VGGVLVGLEVGVLSLIMAPPYGFDDGIALLHALAAAKVATVQFTPMFLMGLILIGVPTWLFLHRRGRRARSNAVWTGIALVTTCTLLLSLLGGPLGLVVGLFLAVGLAIPAGAAGWTLHAIAYRKPAAP